MFLQPTFLEEYIMSGVDKNSRN